jgi:hypothetical protein
MAADTVQIPVAELAAYRAVAAAALAWENGRTGADPIADAVRRHRRTLDPRDPGEYLAWPEQDQAPEPVPGLDYLPTDDPWTYERLDEDADPAPLRPGIGGWDPAPEMTEHYAAVRAA